MIKYKNFIVFFLLVFFSAGCRTTNAPISSYESWNPPSYAKIDKSEDAVWSSIREQKIDTSKPLALIELVDIALRNNPDLRQSWDLAKAQEAVQGQAESSYYPSAVGAVLLERQKTNASIKQNDVDQLQTSPSLQLNYLLFDFGGRRASLEQAFQSLLVSNFQFNQKIQDLLFNVSKYYYELYSAQSALDASVYDLLDSKTAYTAATDKFQVGLVAKLDVLQTKANYDNAMYTFEDAKGQVKTAKANLARVIGVAADTKFEIVAPEKELSKGIVRNINKKNITNIIENALDRRPDISAARASLRASEASVMKANSDIWPTVNLSGLAQKDWYELYGKADPSSADDYTYAGFVNVSWDMFNGFYNINKKREAEARRDAARDSLRMAELSASADVWTKFYGFRTAVQKYSASKAYLESSRGSYQLALEGYNAGIKSILDLLNAENDLSSARSKLINSKKELFVALADLARATGVLDSGTFKERLNEIG
jgi:TolC family type I secretion outer membrane protein